MLFMLHTRDDPRLLLGSGKPYQHHQVSTAKCTSTLWSSKLLYMCNNNASLHSDKICCLQKKLLEKKTNILKPKKELAYTLGSFRSLAIQTP